MSNTYAPVVDLSVLNPLIAEELLRVDAECDIGIENGGAWGDIVNINDKGVLTGVSMVIGVSAAGGTASSRIYIDGVFMANPTMYLQYNAKGDSISLAFTHRFVTSLQIQIKAGVAGDTLYGQGSYTIDV